jgi:hypothetical protein
MAANTYDYHLSAQRLMPAPIKAAAAMPVVYQMRMKGAVYSTQWKA